MGVLTDLIIGTAAEIAAVREDEAPPNVLPSLDIKGFGLVDLGVLYAVAMGAEFDPRLEQFPIVAGQDAEDGPWVFRFSDELADYLLGLSEHDLSSTAALLIQSDQFSDWEQSELRTRLSEIRAFVLNAKGQHKPLHVWTSL